MPGEASKNQAVATFKISSDQAVREIKELKAALTSLKQGGESQSGVSVRFRQQGLSSLNRDLTKGSQDFADLGANIEDVSRKLAVLRKEVENFRRAYNAVVSGQRQIAGVSANQPRSQIATTIGSQVGFPPAFAQTIARLEDTRRQLSSTNVQQQRLIDAQIREITARTVVPPGPNQDRIVRRLLSEQRGAASLTGILAAGGAAGAGLAGLGGLGAAGGIGVAGSVISGALAALPLIAEAVSRLNFQTESLKNAQLFIGNSMKFLGQNINSLNRTLQLIYTQVKTAAIGLLLSRGIDPASLFRRGQGALPPAQQFVTQPPYGLPRPRTAGAGGAAAGGGGPITPLGPIPGPPPGGGGGGGGRPLLPPGPPPGGVPGSRRPFFAAVRTLTQYAAAAAFIYPVFQAFRDALSTAVAFEDELRQIQGILPSKSLEQSLLIGDRVLLASQKYGVNVREAIVAARTFAQTGTDLNAILEDTEAALLAVRAIGFSPEQAKELLIAVRQITNEEVASFDVLDRISRVEAQRAVSAQDLAEAIKGSAPLVRQLAGEWTTFDSNLNQVRVGYKGLLDEIDIVNAATSQLVENTRVTGRQAATSLRFILARLGRPEVVESIQDITGVGLGTKESGGRQLRPVLEILKDLSVAYQNLVKAGETGEATRLLTQIAGARQINAASVLLTNFERFVDTAELSALSFGDTQVRLALQLDTTAAKLTQLGNAIRGIGIELQQGAFGTGIKIIITGLTQLIELFGSLGGPGILTGVLAAISASKLLSVTFTSLFGILTKAKTPLAGTITQLSLFATTTGGLAARWKIFTGLFSSTGFLKVLSPLVKFLGPTGVIVAGLTAILGLVGLIGKIREKRENERNPFGFELPDLGEVNLDQYKKAAAIFKEFRAAQQAGADVSNVPDFLQEIEGALKKFVVARFGEKFVDEDVEKRLRRTPQLINEIFAEFRDTPALKTFVERVDKATETLKGFEKQALITHEVTSLIGQAVFVNNAILNSFDQQVLATAGALGELIKVQVQGEKFQKKLNDTFQIGVRQDLSSTLGINELKKRYIELFSTLEGSAGRFGVVLTEELLAFEPARREITAGLRLTLGETQLSYGALLDAQTKYLNKVLDADAETVKSAGPVNALLTKREDVLGRIAQRFIDSARAQQQGGKSDLFESLTQTDRVTNFLALIDRLFGTASSPGQLIQAIRARLTDEGVDPGRITALIERITRFGEGQRLVFQQTLGFIPKFKDLINDLLIDLFASFRLIDLNAQAAERLGIGYDRVGESYRSAIEFGKRFFTIQSDIEKQILKTVTQIRNLEDAATSRLPEGGLFKGIDTDSANLSDSLRESVEDLKDFEKEQQTAADAAKRQRARLALEAGDAAKTLQIALSLTGPDNLLNILEDFKLLQADETVPKAQREVVDNLLSRFQLFFGDLIKVRKDILKFPGLEEALKNPLGPEFIELSKNPEFREALKNFLLNYRELGEGIINQLVPITRGQELAKRLRTLVEDQSLALFEGLTESFASGQRDIAKAQSTLQNYGQTATTVLSNELSLLEKNRNIELQTRAAVTQARRDQLLARQADSTRRQDLVDLQEQLNKLTTEQQVQDALTRQNFERERYLAILQASIDAETQLRSITESNLETRISGLKDVLSDYEGLTQGGALRAIFEPLGKGILTRQIDQLIQNLFDPTRGIFKKAGEILGQTGEQEALRQAQILRDKATAETFSQSFQFGATTTSNAIITAFEVGAQLTFNSITSALGTSAQGAGVKEFDFRAGIVPDVDTILGKETVQFFQDLPGLLHTALPTGVGGAGAPTTPARKLTDQQATRNQILSQVGTIAGFFAGTSIGGGGPGGQIGSQVGGGAGLFALQALAITNPILAALLPFGGAILGGLLGGLFGGGEEPEAPKYSPLDVIARNTGETVTLLENTNELLQAQGLSFNVPTGFNLPAFTPSLAGASVGAGLLLSSQQGTGVNNNISVSVTLNGTGLSAEAVGREVADAVASRLDNEYRSSGRFVRRLG